MSEKEPQEIIFRVGTRPGVALSRADANEIHGRAVERSLPAQALHSAISVGMRTGEVAIHADEVRVELVLVLKAIAEGYELSDGQAQLLDVAVEPLTPQNP
jgi:hypothetical protein